MKERASQQSVALPPLRFPSVPMTQFREDFNLQVRAHAGRTKKNARGSAHRRRLPCHVPRLQVASRLDLTDPIINHLVVIAGSDCELGRFRPPRETQ